MVSCNPRRYKHHHDFYIKMEIRNNPYFDDIKFRINGSCITLETVGDIGGGIGGAALAGLFQGVGLSTAGVQTHSYRNSSENRRYEECRMICQKIEQAVEDGKRGASVAAQDPVQMLFAKISNAKMEELDALLKEGSELTWNRPDYKEIQHKIVEAISTRTNQLHMMRVSNQMNAAVTAVPQAPDSSSTEPRTSRASTTPSIARPSRHFCRARAKCGQRTSGRPRYTTILTSR